MNNHSTTPAQLLSSSHLAPDLPLKPAIKEHIGATGNQPLRPYGPHHAIVKLIPLFGVLPAVSRVVAAAQPAEVVGNSKQLVFHGGGVGALDEVFLGQVGVQHVF
jgi:hypothetical protein